MPGDRSRPGSAPVPIPGALRLAFELGLFGLAIWAPCDADSQVLALILAGLAAVR